MILFSTDIDGTLYDGSPDSAIRFQGVWRKIAQSLPSPPLLAYNTGRSLANTQSLIADSPLPSPDYYICGVGTVIVERVSGEPLPGWDEHLSANWDFAQVKDIVSTHSPAIFQPDECQNPFKCSWFWTDAKSSERSAINEQLRTSGIDAQVVYSSQRDLDVLPAKANKGNASTFLQRRLGLDDVPLIVAGDSGNDISLFEAEDARGIVVSNAESSLMKAASSPPHFHASEPCIKGVEQGLAHFLHLSG